MDARNGCGEGRISTSKTVNAVSQAAPQIAPGHAGGVHPLTHHELIVWCNPIHKPDADTTVMLSLEGLSEPTFPGYWNGMDWIDCTGSVVTDHVTSWAHMPAGFFPTPRAGN